tara:strand:+ start:6248 stop:6784 length:537 start_codon:yes stop_codon:yes gene_type:complete
MHRRTVRTISILTLIIFGATIIRAFMYIQTSRELFTAFTIDVKEMRALAAQRYFAEKIARLSGPSGETFPTEEDPVSKIYGVNDYGKGRVVEAPHGLKLCTYNNKEGCLASCVVRGSAICPHLCNSKCYSNGTGTLPNYSLTKDANFINSDKTWNRDKSSPNPHATLVEHAYMDTIPN